MIIVLYTDTVGVVFLNLLVIYASTASPIAHLATVPVPPIVSTANRLVNGVSFLLRVRSTSCARKPPRIASVGGKK
jgi:hypothetical protein